MTFVATRWELYEASLCGVPADIASAVRRAGGDSDHIEATRERMRSRERMAARTSNLEASDDDVAAIINRVIERHAEMEEASILLDAEIETADQALN